MARKNIYEYYDDSYGSFSNLYGVTEEILDLSTAVKELAEEFDSLTETLMNRANNRHTSDRQLKTFLQDNDGDIDFIMNSLEDVEDSLSVLVSKIKRLRY